MEKEPDEPELEMGRPATKLEALMAKVRAAGVEQGRMEEMDRAAAEQRKKVAEADRAAWAKWAEMYRAATEQRNKVVEADRAAARAANELYDVGPAGLTESSFDSDYDHWVVSQPSTSSGRR